jgi:hypothetical protein
MSFATDASNTEKGYAPDLVESRGNGVVVDLPPHPDAHLSDAERAEIVSPIAESRHSSLEYARAQRKHARLLTLSPRTESSSVTSTFD